MELMELQSRDNGGDHVSIQGLSLIVLKSSDMLLVLQPIKILIQKLSAIIYAKEKNINEITNYTLHI